MEPNKKEMYLFPEVDIFEVKGEDAICGSPADDIITDPDDYANGDDPFGF